VAAAAAAAAARAAAWGPCTPAIRWDWPARQDPKPGNRGRILGALGSRKLCTLDAKCISHKKNLSTLKQRSAQHGDGPKISVHAAEKAKTNVCTLLKDLKNIYAHFFRTLKKSVHTFQKDKKSVPLLP
jgi:hypothetical protein